MPASDRLASFGCNFTAAGRPALDFGIGAI